VRGKCCKQWKNGNEQGDAGLWFSPDVNKSVEKTKDFANTRTLEMTELSQILAGGKNS
jgi:hypothetical protein